MPRPVGYREETILLAAAAISDQPAKAPQTRISLLVSISRKLSRNSFDRQALHREGGVEDQDGGDQEGIEDELIEQARHQPPAERAAPLVGSATICVGCGPLDTEAKYWWSYRQSSRKLP